ncbi:MAG: hypothetical protein AAB534_01965 [Patescibacteria group bacterium]
MITLSNGHSFEYMVASGALGFDGRGWWWEKPLVWLGLLRPELFTVVTKTLTLNHRPGNLRMWKPWDCVRLIPGGAVNKVGLTNPGFDWWCRKIGPKVNRKKIPIIVSISGTRAELKEMTKVLRRSEFDIVGIEVNLSCPNSGDHLKDIQSAAEDVRAVWEESHLPVLAKLSVDQPYLEITKAIERYAEAIALNSVRWETVFPHEVTPLHKLEKRVGNGSGGVSGKPAQKHNWPAVEALAKQGLLPVIAPSIMKFDDMKRVRDLGAQAVSFGAIHLRTPWKPTSIVRKERRMQASRRDSFASSSPST